ncbi:MAG: SRPBCC family protein [Polyangiales bacterium]
MHPTHTIHVEREIEAAAVAVWERVQDHANTGSFVDGAHVRLVQNGTPSPNGVNAKRELTFPKKRSWSMFKILEEVTAYEAPRTFSYKILSGMPAVNDHPGTRRGVEVVSRYPRSAIEPTPRHHFSARNRTRTCTP